MSAQTFVQKILQKHLIRSQAKNPTYSIRSFARRLEISPSALSEILNGKRKISLQMAKRLLLKTSANAKEMEQALRLFKGSSKTEEKETNGFEEISLQQFNIIADWYHFAILSLAETDDFRDEPEWIANRLNLSKPKVTQALQRLSKLGMLKRKSGRYFATGKQFHSSDEVVNLALRKAHYQNLELAKRSLEKDPIDIRDFNSITMAIDPDKIPMAKKMIRKFKKDLCKYLETTPKKEVFKLCIQLIPLTQTKEGKR